MIGVIGSGSWATAIVKILLEEGSRRVNWWVRRKEVQQCLASTGRNPSHLHQMTLDHTRLSVSTDLSNVVAASDLLIVSVPSIYVASVLGSIPCSAYKGKRMASAVKGFVPQQKASVSEYLKNELAVPEENICVVSGPSHAEEVAASQPTFLNVASSNPLLANEMADLLRCSYIHPLVSGDVQNIELCGLAKNVYAVAAGIATGLGYGDNLVAVLTAAAARELKALMRGDSEPAFMLSDLTVTCFSRHSRNRSLGVAVAKGTAPEEHLASTGMVAEGYYSADIMHSLPKRCDTPIADAVYRVLYTGAEPQKEIDQLITTCF